LGNQVVDRPTRSRAPTAPREAAVRRPFQDLAREQLPRLYGLARRLGADDPEDLVQETLLRAFGAYRTLRSPEASQRWLTSMLVNVFRDQLRRKARHVPQVSLESLDEFSLYRQIADEDPFPYSDTLHDDFLELFEPEDVHRVLAGLPPHYRAPLVLRYVEGYPTKRVAHTLGLPLGTVLAQLHRGRKAFERALWDYAQRSGFLEKERVR
jgi:RNA polymerase sigma-70 factor (ECF subfamily)